MHCGYFYIARKGNHSSFLTPTVVGGRRPFHLKFALKVTDPLRKNAHFDRFPLTMSHNVLQDASQDLPEILVHYTTQLTVCKIFNKRLTYRTVV